MAKQTWVNVSGTWRKVKSAWVNVNGVWKKDVMPKGVVSGSWKEFMSYASGVFTFNPTGLISIFEPDGESKNYTVSGIIGYTRYISDGEHIYAARQAYGGTYKFNLFGQTIWSRTYDKDGDWALEATVDNDLNIHKFNKVSSNSGNTNYRKYNKNGLLIDSQTSRSGMEYGLEKTIYVKEHDAIYGAGVADSDAVRGNIYKFDANGKLIWSKAIMRTSGWNDTRVIGLMGNDLVSVGLTDIVHFTPTGTIRKTINIGDDYARVRAHYLTKDNIFMGKSSPYSSNAGFILKYDKDFNQIWQVSNVPSEKITVSKDGSVYGLGDGRLIKLNTNGGTEWVIDTEAPGSLFSKDLGLYSTFPEQW